MKLILVQQSPHKSPWAPTRLRQAMQTGGRRRSASVASARPSAPAAEKALDCAVGSEVISAPPIAMDVMIEPEAGMAEEAQNA
jgi:hypothetical protein